MTAVSTSDRDRLAITTIRTTCMGAVERADPGHPGTPMAMAPTPEALVRLAKSRVERPKAR